MQSYNSNLLSTQDQDSVTCFKTENKYKNIRQEVKFNLNGSRTNTQLTFFNANKDVKILNKHKIFNRQIENDFNTQTTYQQNFQKTQTLLSKSPSLSIPVSISDTPKIQEKSQSQQQEQLSFDDLLNKKLKEIMKNIPKSQRKHFLLEVYSHFDYFQHHLEICKCFLCKCGLCKCQFVQKCNFPNTVNEKIKISSNIQSQYNLNFQSPDKYKNHNQIQYFCLENVDNISSYTSQRVLDTNHKKTHQSKDFQVNKEKGPAKPQPPMLNSYIPSLSSYKVNNQSKSQHLNYHPETCRADFKSIPNLPRNLHQSQQNSAYTDQFLKHGYVVERKNYLSLFKKRNPIGSLYPIITHSNNNEFFPEVKTLKFRLNDNGSYVNLHEHTHRFEGSISQKPASESQRFTGSIPNVIDCQTVQDNEWKNLLLNKVRDYISN